MSKIYFKKQKNTFFRLFLKGGARRHRLQEGRVHQLRRDDAQGKGLRGEAKEEGERALP
tara:strand:+ start:411 stop:587 length:177 start_codon:yes stop_codon:yes gene_type:complete